MIKLLIIHILVLLGYTLVGQTHVRATFQNGMFNEDSLELIISNHAKSNEALIQSYVGVSNIMMADHSYLLTTKLSYFNEGKAILDSAILKKKNNAEIRYLRLLIQLNTPKFLEYDNNIEEDLVYLEKNLRKELSSGWVKIFLNNLLAGEYLTVSHKNRIIKLKQAS